MTTGLTFDTLRGANGARLPLFRNAHGERAHAKPDGSDWSPAMWFLALVGELGDLAELRCQYEAGIIDEPTYHALVGGELADVQIYLDLFAKRCLDRIDGTAPQDFAQQLMGIVAELGTWANAAKKRVRGDYTPQKFALQSGDLLDSVRQHVVMLGSPRAQEAVDLRQLNGVREAGAHPVGVKLGVATIHKFNATSTKVKAPVYIDTQGDRYTRPAEGAAE